jgi:hypothetical protein
MPLVTAQNHIKSLLDGLAIPGPAHVGPLEAFITPPDPREDPPPAAYIWPSGGTETRRAVPRNSGPGTPAGLKSIRLMMDVYLTWFNTVDDPYADGAFPSVIDAVMQALRTSPDPATVVDPDSGLVCELVGVGEGMSWQNLGVNSAADQRWLRYDALIQAPFLEFIQA